MPRATDHIPEMVALIRSAGREGIHLSEGRVGLLQHLPIPRIREAEQGRFQRRADGRAASIPTNTTKKMRATSSSGKPEERRGGFLGNGNRPGRPGWHIECSAMSMKYLGETFDIHCGGVDLIFPAPRKRNRPERMRNGKPFVRYWVHPEFLIVEGEKMSKSLGNFFTLRDLLSQGHSPEAIRYLLLSVHYRKQLNFTTDGLHQAQASIQRLEDFVLRVKEKAKAEEASPEFKAEVQCRAAADFIEAMDDDINTSAALAAVFDFVRSTYQKDTQNALLGRRCAAWRLNSSRKSTAYSTSCGRSRNCWTKRLRPRSRRARRPASAGILPKRTGSASGCGRKESSWKTPAKGSAGNASPDTWDRRRPRRLFSDAKKVAVPAVFQQSPEIKCDGPTQ